MILVVDDDAAVLDVLRLLLESAGFGVATAATVREARERIGDAAPDLVLTDYRLPDGTGVDVASLAAARGIPVIVLTAEPAARELTNAPAAAILGKPPDRTVLLDVVRESLIATRPAPDRAGSLPTFRP